MTTVARPYASAAFEYALAHGDLPAWIAMLQSAAAISQDETMLQLLSNPKVTKNQLVDLYCDVLGDLLNEPRRNFIRLLADNGRFAVLPDIATAVEAYRAVEEKTLVAKVISAIPLTDTHQQQLAQSLTKRFGRQTLLQNEIDPTVLGGIIIRAGDTVIDGSVRGKLSRLLDVSLR